MEKEEMAPQIQYGSEQRLGGEEQGGEQSWFYHRERRDRRGQSWRPLGPQVGMLRRRLETREGQPERWKTMAH